MRETKVYLQNRLKALYPQEEVRAISNLVFETILEVPPYRLLMMDGEQLPEPTKEKIKAIADRLAAGEPIQYILGYADFDGSRFLVTPDVLIPRPETAELISWIAEEAHGKTALRVMDIGTGSGCIAIRLAARLPESRVYGVDVSEAALLVAQENAKAHRLQITWIQQDILQAKAEDLPQQLDMLVSNPPYIMDKEKVEMEAHVLEHEPHLALFVPDNDPLRFYRAIARLGRQLLKTNGSLFFEINARCGKEMQEMLREEGYSEVVIRRDFYGKERMIKATF